MAGKKSEANGSTNGTHHTQHFNDYRRLASEKDPIIDLIRTECQIEFNGHVGGRIAKANLERLSLDSGIGVQTLRAWLYGQTRRPRHLSTRFVLEALGITTRRFRRDGTEIKSNW